MPDIDEYRKKLNSIKKWAKSRGGKFSLDWVYSVLEYIDDRDEISDSQADGVDNIIRKWRIKVPEND